MQTPQLWLQGNVTHTPLLVITPARQGSAACRSRVRRLAPCFASSRATAELDAVVIGSGFAGLSAAAGLSKRFKQVTLLERDSIPFPAPQDVSEPDTGRQRLEVEVLKRQGVAQYAQPHLLLKRGLELMEELFPDYCDKLIKAGALQTDLLRDTIIDDWGKVWAPGRSSDLHCLAASRHLYETILRTCVAEVDNIKVQTKAMVTGVQYNSSSKRVTGVKLKDNNNIQADLIVDASGSSSKMAEWLEQQGHAPAPTMTVDAGLRYTARMYEISDDPDRKWSSALINSHPEFNRSAAVLPIETNKWQVLVAGYPGSYCPTDEEGFMEFVRNLPTSTVYDALSKAKPITPITSFAKTRNFRRLYEQVPPPKGLCVIGDAACCFNPINGQGMTVGIMGSRLLCETIDKQLAKAGSERQQQLNALDSLPAAFHQQLGKMLDYPWAVATGQDAKKPCALVELPEDKKAAVPAWLNDYLVYLMKACFSDQYMMTKLAAVNHMIAPPTALFMPDMALRVLWHWLGDQSSSFQKRLQGSAASA